MGRTFKEWFLDICAEATEFLNAMTWGGKDMSFSAKSAALAAKGAVLGKVRTFVVNVLALPFEDWKWGHCERAYANYLARTGG